MKALTISILLFLILFFSAYAQIPQELPEILPQEPVGVWTRKIWEEERRPEILRQFRKQVYGEFPHDFNPLLKFEILEESDDALEGKAIRKQVKISLLNPENGKSLDIVLLIYLPAGVEAAVPVFLGMNFYGNHSIHPDPAILLANGWVRNNPGFHIENNQATEASRGVRVNRWPVEYILSRGYAIATLYYGDLDPDFHDEFRNGLHGLYYDGKEDYPSDGAAAISAWAFGLSKVMDYFTTDEDLDHNQVALFGHSRLGKAALWAGAMDGRFALVISNNSGCGGAALSMRKHGETLEAINKSFPHWFCRNFSNYNSNEEALPVDQHMLLACIAPRPLYVASAQEDDWADPYGEQISAFLASSVYELYDLNVFLEKTPRTVNFPLKTGFVGYHIRSGEHDIKGYDWEQFLDFADLHLLF